MRWASRDRARDARMLTVAHMAGYRVDSVVQLGEGLVHVGYKINGELIVRFSKESNPARRAAGVTREVHLLDFVSAI